MNFVERKDELSILENAYKSKKSSFVAVYGRRRIGKTELINQFFNEKGSFLFSLTGAYDASLDAHLDNFRDKIRSTFPTLRRP